MRVLLGDQRAYLEGLLTQEALELHHLVHPSQVGPLDVPTGQRLATVWTGLRHVVPVDRYVGVLLLLRVDPLDDAVVDEVGPPELPDPQVFQVLACEDRPAIGQYQERPPHAAFVAIEDNLVHGAVEAYVHLVAQEARASPLPHLTDESPGVLMEADQVSVDVDAGQLGLLALYLLRA